MLIINSILKKKINRKLYFKFNVASLNNKLYILIYLIFLQIFKFILTKY